MRVNVTLQSLLGRARAARARLGAKRSVALLALPPALFGVLHFGPRAALVMLLSIAVCVLASVLPRALSRQPYVLFNPGTLVTSLLLGMTMSHETPIYMVVVGGLVAEIAGKQTFFRLRRPLLNPAALGRGAVAVLEVLDPYPIPDVVTSASPLMLTAGGHAAPDLLRDLLLGLTRGAIGETSRLLLLLCGVPLLLLVARKRQAALGLLLSVPLWVSIMPASPAITGHAPWVLNPLVYLLGGSTALMAFFFCTDPMTTPRTRLGGWIFGAGAGLIGVVGRLYTTIPGCEMWGVLVMNALTPVLDLLIERAAGRETPGAARPAAEVESFYAAPPPVAHPPLGADPSQALAALRAGLPDAPFSVLTRARANGLAEVIKDVEQGALRGCGGAHFPAAAKWRAVRRQAGPRVLVINGQEGEGESSKDHFVMEHAPHLLLEGALLAAQAIEAGEVYVVIDPRAEAAHAALCGAAADARRVFGEELGCDVYLVRGPGLFVVGEETALLQYLEGRRGEPRLRPPFPSEAGLRGRPTVIHNVETVSWLPRLLHGGGAAFQQAGPPKLVTVSGGVARPGVYAVPLGTPIAQVVEIAGGVAAGRTVQAYAVGGPSGGFLPPEAASTPLSEAALMQAGAMLGTASVRVIHAGECLVRECLDTLRFFERESCGRCAPCRIGTGALRRLGEELLGGRCGPEAQVQAEEISAALYAGSFCGLGRGVPNRLRTIYRYWPALIEAHARGRGCPACKG